MQPLLSSAQMREADREAIQEFTLPETVLMEHAGISLCQRLEARFGAGLPKTRGVILAGPGRNGGDVLVAARLLHERGVSQISVVLFDAERPVCELTARQLKILSRLGLAWERELRAESLSGCDWILDGLVGIGLSRAIGGVFKSAIDSVNALSPGDKKWIVAADIPSGLSSDTGLAQGCAIRASETVAFGFYKRGLVTGEAANYVGRLRLAPIQIPRVVSSAGWDTFLYTEEDARRLPSRTRTSHKGDYGHVALLLGATPTEGATALAALGALKAGAGLATVVGDAVDSLRARLAVEIMTESTDDFFAKPRATVLVVGPGLGQGSSPAALLARSLEFPGALVCDADALNIFASDPARWKPLVKARKYSTVFTPHPKEAARLLQTQTEKIQSDRFTALSKLIFEWSCYVVLKGPGTLIGSSEMPVVAVCAGDDGLAKGGTGDLLAGILASCLAQGLKPAQALPLGVFLHGQASERQTQKSGTQRSTLATDLADRIPEIFRALEWKA